MANYLEQTGTGTAWRRAKQVIINNPYNSSEKRIIFQEEDVALIGESVFTNSAGILMCNFEPDALIPLLDPETGQPTGNTMPQKLVYQALYSLYVKTAKERDTPPLVVNPEVSIANQPA